MRTALSRLACSAAAATVAAACSPCLAQSQVQIYGTFDAAVGQIETQPPGAPTAAIVRVRGVHSGTLQTSYIGFRGVEDLGGGLKARFLIESFFRGDTGQNGRFDASPTSGADAFWSREAYVALGGSFGELRLGNNGNPLWVTMLQTNAFSSNSVFSPSFRQMFNGGARGRSEVDTSMVNSIKYASPVLAGFSADIALQAGEGSGTRYNHAFSIGYRSGPLVLGLATQTLRHAAVPNLPGARNQTMTLAGGAYDFGPVRVFAQYTAIDNKRLGTKDKLPHFGITVPLGAGVLQLGSGDDKTTGATPAATAKRTTTTAGYVYSLSRRTNLYTFLMNDKVAVGTAKSYVVGVRHTF